MSRGPGRYTYENPNGSRLREERASDVEIIHCFEEGTPSFDELLVLFVASLSV